MHARLMNHSCLRLGVALGMSLAMVGCRSTRNSISGLPGMGWMASQDEPNVSDWETEPSTLAKPNEDATPQLASRGKATSSSSKSAERSETKSSNGYPDTGMADYSAISRSTSESARDKYAAGKYGGSSRDTETPAASGPSYSTARAGGAPKRGFYTASGDDAGDAASRTENEDTASSAESDLDRGYSRYSKAAKSAIGDAKSDFQSARNSASELSSNATKSASRYARDARDTAEDLASDASEAAEDAQETTGNLADDMKSGYQKASREFTSQMSEAKSDVAAASRNVVEDAEESARSAYQEAADAASEEVEDTKEEVAEKGRELKEAAVSSLKRANDAADELATSGVEAAEGSVKRAYSRFQNRFAAAAEDASSDTAEATESSSSADAQEDAASDTAENAPTESESDLDEPPATKKRPAKPWRPGSTGSYTKETDEARRPSDDRPVVERASYRDGGNSRFSPSYR